MKRWLWLAESLTDLVIKRFTFVKPSKGQRQDQTDVLLSQGDRHGASRSTPSQTREGEKSSDSRRQLVLEILSLAEHDIVLP